MVSIMYNLTSIYIYIYIKEECSTQHITASKIYSKTPSPLNFNLVSEHYTFERASIYNQRLPLILMDPTAAQSSPLLTANTLAASLHVPC